MWFVFVLWDLHSHTKDLAGPELWSSALCPRAPSGQNVRGRRQDGRGRVNKGVPGPIR